MVFFINIYIYIIYVLAALGLHYYTQAFSSSSEEGLLLLAMPRFLLQWLLLL